jgi:hypothetical protein
MKTKTPLKNFIPFITMLIFTGVGLNVALIVYRTYEPIAEGITGLALLALVYRVYYLSPELNAKEPTRFLFEYPGGFRYLGFGVFWAIVNFWALKQIIDMVFYLATRQFE